MRDFLATLAAHLEDASEEAQRGNPTKAFVLMS